MKPVFLMMAESGFDPDLRLVCLWCGKDFSPYSQMVLRDYAFACFCSEDHYVLYHKYGKVKNFFDNIPRYLIWKPYYALLDWWYRKDCPYCHIRMMSPLAGELYCCMECGRDFEVVKEP